jgi:hypothetical protein
MPVKKDEMKLIISHDIADLKKIRIPGIDKSLENMTISELSQLRPGGAVSDTYEVNAIGDNISATTSALLAELGKVRAQEVMRSALVTQKLDQRFGRLGPK